MLRPDGGVTPYHDRLHDVSTVDCTPCARFCGRGAGGSSSVTRAIREWNVIFLRIGRLVGMQPTPFFRLFSSSILHFSREVSKGIIVVSHRATEKETMASTAVEPSMPDEPSLAEEHSLTKKPSVISSPVTPAAAIRRRLMASSFSRPASLVVSWAQLVPGHVPGIVDYRLNPDVYHSQQASPATTFGRVVRAREELVKRSRRGFGTVLAAKHSTLTQPAAVATAPVGMNHELVRSQQQDAGWCTPPTPLPHIAR